jgi:lysophospholipase L1-like esterase
MQKSETAMLKRRDGLGNLFGKLRKGGPVNIAYLGGSITQAPGWRLQTLESLKKEFPNAQLKEINAGIGGTGSDLGVFRLQVDVLEQKPDLLFVEFAVNDSGRKAEDIVKSMEGIVRQAWKANPKLDICFVYTYVEGFEKDIQEGLPPPSIAAMERVAEHYGIPSIDMSLRIFSMMKEGRLVVKAPSGLKTEDGKMVFSRDGVHPLPETGHLIYTDVIMDGLGKLNGATPLMHRLPAQMDKDNWENAKLVPLEPWMLSSGWEPVSRQEMAKLLGTPLQTAWSSCEPGASMTLKFHGRLLGTYEILGPDSGIVSHSVDGAASKISHFGSDCYIYRHKLMLEVNEMKDAEHAVELKLLAEKPDISSCVKRAKEVGVAKDVDKLGKALAWRVAYLAIIGNIEKPK